MIWIFDHLVVVVLLLLANVEFEHRKVEWMSFLNLFGIDLGFGQNLSSSVDWDVVWSRVDDQQGGVGLCARVGENMA